MANGRLPRASRAGHDLPWRCCEESDDVPVQIRKPDALPRARFMAYSLYLLKICLFQDQFTVDNQHINNAMNLVEYIALIHTLYYLKCPLTIPTSRNDRHLWVDLAEYKKCF